MGDNYKNDGLEDFFRKRLEGFEEEPKSNMWGKIAVGIPAKPPVVWWLKPISWMGAILLGVLVFSYWQYQQLNQIEKIVTKQSAIIKALETFKQNTLQTQTASIQPAEQSEVIDLPSSPMAIADNQKIAPSEHVVKKAIRQSSNTIGNVENNYSKNTSKDAVTTSFIKKSSNAQLMGAVRNKRVTETTVRRRPMAKADFLHFLKPQPIYIPAYAIYQKPRIQPVHQVKFYMALQTGVFNTFYNGFINNSLSKTLESNVSGYHLSNTLQKQASLLAGFQFNKIWSLELGFGFRENSLTLFDAKNFTYTAELFNVTDEGGFPVAIFATSLSSPPSIRYELANFTKNDGEDINEGDAFALNSFFSYNTRYFSLPLWIKMKIGKRRFHGFTKIGASWNVLTGSRYGLDKANLTFDRIVLKKASITNDALSNSFFELGVGMGIEYDFTQHVALSLQSTYYHSLSAVLSSKQNALGLGLTMKYQF